MTRIYAHELTCYHCDRKVVRDLPPNPGGMTDSEWSVRETRMLRRLGVCISCGDRMAVYPLWTSQGGNWLEGARQIKSKS